MDSDPPLPVPAVYGFDPIKLPISTPLVGSGTFGYVFRISTDRVLKVPKAYPEPEDAYINSVNLEDIQNEGNIYKRLGVHSGILRCFSVCDNSIELAFANQGSLLHYMRETPIPGSQIRLDWILSLSDTFSYAHSQRVVVQDIDLQNIVVHDGTLKLIDFGQSFLLPLDTDMDSFCVNETTLKMEILHLGCIFYSIATWTRFKYYYFDYGRFPLDGELPSTKGVLGNEIIDKCWNGEYASMDALAKDVLSYLT
ncbi:hypothetical protein FE257_010268 [Aspergillus nanangensis]|uniref:Protein kinase domain-containing protein n=1 Tax=Aspergillus nanangensis TaxID=2582783 RepID=A0AAD4GTG7_ASPNN|nr:hypothetical protein FE257_010268 [Aspergillus nanangensis]